MHANATNKQTNKQTKETSIKRPANKGLSLLAFTLAEVLIVISIIGIIAEYALPSVVTNIKTQQAVSGLEKFYGTLQQATALAIKDNGTPDSWSNAAAGSAQGATDIKNIYARYMLFTKACDADATCYPNWTFLNSTTTWIQADAATLQLNDGSIVTFRNNSSSTSSSGTGTLANCIGPINIDINGFKPPNQFGRDAFRFMLTASGQIIPSGVTDDTISFDTWCLNKTSVGTTGQGCTAWVIYNKNMDYLKPCGSTLSWGGPTSCN